MLIVVRNRTLITLCKVNFVCSYSCTAFKNIGLMLTGNAPSLVNGLVLGRIDLRCIASDYGHYVYVVDTLDLL